MPSRPHQVAGCHCERHRYFEHKKEGKRRVQSGLKISFSMGFTYNFQIVTNISTPSVFSYSKTKFYKKDASAVGNNYYFSFLKIHFFD